jgi:hypothetical protein
MDRAMDETKISTETHGPQPLGEGSTGSYDETKSLSDTNGLQPPVEGSGASAPFTQELLDGKYLLRTRSR